MRNASREEERKEFCGRKFHSSSCGSETDCSRQEERQTLETVCRESECLRRTHANQLRLYFSTVAYLLLHLLRRFGLEGTQLEKAQCGTIRLKLLKIGAQLRVTVRKIWISMASGYPYMDLFAEVFRKLRALRPLPAS